MLRANLSTRPFYNERLVTLLLGAAALVVLVLTLFNVYRVTTLTARVSALGAEAGRAERAAVDLRQRAAQARSSVDQARLAAVATAAHEANTLIDRRTFSWTELFNRFEATLPPDVRIAAVRPSVDQDGNLTLGIAVVARSVDAIDTFIEALEETGAFEDVLSREERINEDGEV
jgi:Tfp pilus assembly protein PilN